MEIVTVLAVAFILSTVISRLVKKHWNVIFSGNLAMCIMLCFTAIGHIIYAKGMTMMLPDFIPFKLAIVYITGVMEVIFGILLLGPKYRRKTGIAIIIFFILILPANIYEAVNYVNLETARYNGVGPIYLWFRIPLQLFLIGWVYFFSVRARIDR